MANIPPPPPGVTLDSQYLPPPPPGVTLDPQSPQGPESQQSGVPDVLRALMFAVNPRKALGEFVFNPEAQKATISGLRGQDTHSIDPNARALNMDARYIPMILASAAFPAEEAANLGGIAALQYAPQLGKLGFYGGRALAGAAQAAPVAGAATLATNISAGASPSEALENAKQNARAFGIGQGASEIGIPMVGRAWDELKGLAYGTVKKASELLSGVKPQAFTVLKENPEAVLSAARKGMTVIAETGKEIPVALQDAQAAAMRAKSAIEKAASGAGKKYADMMDFLHSAPQDAEKFDIGHHVSESIEPYLKTQATEYSNPNMSPRVIEERKLFNHYLNWARGAHDMSPSDVADYMKMITGDIKATKGTSISAHLSELKNHVLDALPGEYRYPTVVDTPHPEGLGWDIRGTRDEYASAKQLQKNLKGLTNSQNPANTIIRMFQNNGKEAQALREAAEKIPELKSALEEMKPALAGAEFAPKIGNLPRTGLVGGAAVALTKALSNPIAASEVPLMISGSSPRLTANLLAKTGPAVSGAIQNMASKALPGIPAAIATPQLADNTVAPQAPSENQIVASILRMNTINPSKSGTHGKELSSLGLPSSMVSKSGKSSLSQVAQKLYEGGRIKENDEDEAMDLIKKASGAIRTK